MQCVPVKSEKPMYNVITVQRFGFDQSQICLIEQKLAILSRLIKKIYRT